MANDCAPWWRKPYRIVQTNLRLTDATLDPKALAGQARDFGATAVTFNVGGIYAFYPTELPLHARNPFLKSDLTGEMLEALHREGLRMIGRYDLSKATSIAYEKHPEWFVHNASGAPLEYNGTYQACVNGGWYSDYAERILEESLLRYPVDGVFINMLGYRSYDYSGNYHGICRCANCEAQFKEMYARALPEREEFSDPSYRDYLEFQDRTSEARTQRLYDVVKRVRPATGVMLERAASDFMRLELQRAIERPQPEWPHQAGEKSRWAAAFGKGEKAFSCASTNFLDFAWRYASETSHHHVLRMAQAVASGAQLDYYLLGLFDQDNAEPIAAVHDFFQWHVRNGHHYPGMRSQATVGLYHSRATQRYAAATTTRAAQGSAFRGAYRVLLESRIPFDLVSDARASDADFGAQLARYRVIVLPNIACMSDTEAAALDAYVAQGGTLIATGETGLYTRRGEPRSGFALDCFPARDVVRASENLQTYVEFAGNGLSTPHTKFLHLDRWYLHCNAKSDAELAMPVLPPQRYGPPELCFLEETPDVCDPGMLTRRHGAGRTIYLPWLPEWLFYRDGLPEHRDLIAQLVLQDAEAPIKVEGVGPVEVTVHRQDGGAGAYVIHVVNYSGQRNNVFAEPISLRDFRIGVKGGCGAVESLMDGATLSVGETDANGFAWIDLPAIGAFLVLRAEAP